MLIQAQTEGWGEDYWKLLEYLSRKLLKEGFIQNIGQYLSALCKSLTSALLFVALCASSLCMSPFFVGSPGRFQARFCQGRLLINILQHKPNAEVRNSCETGAAGHRLSLVVRPDVFASSMAAWLMMNDLLCLNACCHILVNEAATYSLAGVMGLARLQPSDKQLKAGGR